MQEGSLVDGLVDGSVDGSVELGAATDGMKTDLKQLYHADGQLNRGFTGQISYTVCLERPYEALLIRFSFNKQHHERVTKELRDEITNQLLQGGHAIPTVCELDQMILSGTKTEIHTLASLNDVFIGGIHRQLTTREMYFSYDKATEGCIPQPCIKGVLKVTVLVFQVIEDGTDYQLQVFVR